jgi:hypothetical protein
MNEAPIESIRCRACSISVLLLLAGAAIAFFARGPLADRLWNIRFDILFWDAAGNGLVPLMFGVLSFCLAAAAVIACLWRAVRRGGRNRLVWVALIPVAALPGLGIRAQPSRHDFIEAASRGQGIVRALQQYRNDKGSYPERLGVLVPHYLRAIPDSGLGPSRRFFYAKKGSPTVDRGDWFNGADKLMGRDLYALAVPFVPGGTLVYRPSGNYSDLNGHSVAGVWFHTGRD